MTKKALLEHLVPQIYKIEFHKDGGAKLLILGRRVGRPSQRLTLHQTGLKVLSAKIIWKNKNKIIEHQIDRINHLPTVNEVRLHTAQMQYPGEYEIELSFTGFDEKTVRQVLQAGYESAELRKHFPSIDEDGAKKDIIIEIS